MTNVVHEGQWEAAFSYDPNGNVLNHRGRGGTEVSFSYDSMNRLSSSLIRVNSRSFAVTNFYDLNGNRTNILYPGGLNVGYTFDSENRLASVDLSGFGLSTFDFFYDSASHLTNIVYPNGVTAAFAHDADGRMTEYCYSSGSSNLLRHVMERDALGQKTREDIYAGSVPTFTHGVHQTRTHNDADQLLSAGTETYTYDANGNLRSSAGESFEWDYDNRLTGVSGQGTEVSYLYDASGVRIGRIAGTSSAVTNYFVLDYKAPLKMPLAEADADGHITRYYIWSSHGLLAHLDMNPTNGTVSAVRYYHFDELGSTLALTDQAGSETDRFAYSPYGDLLGHTGTNDTAFRWLGGYGVYYDEDADLHLTLHRAYSANMRRFISTDPSGIDGGVNLYAYANLNPLAFVDPYGLCAESGSSWGSKISGALNSLYAGHLQSEQNYAQKTAAYYNSRDYQQYSTTWAHAVKVGIDDVNEAIGPKLSVATMAYGFYRMPAAPVSRPLTTPPITKPARLPSAPNPVAPKTITDPSRLLPAPAGPNPWVGKTVSEVTTKPVGVERFAGNPKSPWVQIEGAGGTPSTLSLSPGNSANRISSSVIPAGARIQSGTAAAVPKWGGVGGAKQIEILDNNVWQNQMIWEVRPR